MNKEKNKIPPVWFWIVLYFLTAAVSSICRFGQYENENADAVSDSAYYFEMANVFIGTQDSFTEQYVKHGPHHYNRPLFPWLAGHLHSFTGIGLRTCFSLLNLMAATGMALMVHSALKQSMPTWKIPWLPPMLFLTAFPQMNWGYHLLTDTLGLTMAMASTLFAMGLIHRIEENKPGTLIRYVGVFLLSSFAFLTRETGWFAPIAIGWLLLVRWKKCNQTERLKIFMILVMLFLGKIPHSIYESAYELSTPPLHFFSLFAVSPRYWLDVIIKVGVAFHIAWIVVLVVGITCIRKKEILWPPDWIIGWSLAGMAYCLAAYAHNDIDLIGYPMRIPFSLFPLIYFYVESFFESLTPNRTPHVYAILFVIASFAIGLLGISLDPGVPNVTAPGIIDGFL